MGSPGKSIEDGFGTLILKDRLGVADREVAEDISENPYFQYFLGLSSYQNESQVHHSMLTRFRKRFDQKSLEKINEAIGLKAKEMEAVEEKPEDIANFGDAPPSKGNLVVDTTSAPVGINPPPT